MQGLGSRDSSEGCKRGFEDLGFRVHRVASG